LRLPEVELFVNGKSLEKQESKDHFFYFQVPNKGETILVAVAGKCRDGSYIRKVEKFNEAYRLKEEGAVLNWFDITEPEGYFSLNDKVEDIVSTEEGKEKFLNLIGNILSRRPQPEESEGGTGPVFNDNMLRMLGGFTVLRMIGMMGTASLEPMTKEEMLEMNEALNKITFHTEREM